jgi:hypothetical protein
MKENLQVRNVLYFGDLNFPHLPWPSGTVYTSGQANRENKSGENKEAEQLLEFAKENFLEQIVETSTRGNNILDLVFTNNPQLVNFYNIIVNSKLLDHNTVDTNLNFSYNQEKKDKKVVNPYNTKIFEYNTKEADDEDWERFAQHVGYLDPEEKLSGKKPTEMLKKIYAILEKASEVCLKKEADFEEDDKDEIKKKKGSFIPKRVRKLMRKKEKLSKQVMQSNSWMKNFDKIKELEDVEAKIGLSNQSRRKKLKQLKR